MTQHGILWSTDTHTHSFVACLKNKKIKKSEQSYPAGECLATFVTDKRSGDKVWIMVALEVHVQKLLLPESFVTLAAGKWLLSCVCTLVHDHVALL